MRILKITSVALPVLLGCALLTPPAAKADEKAPVKPGPLSIFENSLLIIDASHMESVEKCRNAYAAALKAAEETATQKGDLDAVVKIRKEKTRFDQDRAVDDAIPSDAHPLIQQAMQAYLKDINATESARAKSINELANKYLQHLESLKIRLTKDKKIEEALKVQKEIERAKANPVIIQALSEQVVVKLAPCAACDGTGIKNAPCPDCNESKICSYCKGTGKRSGLSGSMVTCFVCTGTGKCKKCKGTGHSSSRCPDCFGTGRARK